MLLKCRFCVYRNVIFMQLQMQHRSYDERKSGACCAVLKNMVKMPWKTSQLASSVVPRVVVITMPRETALSRPAWNCTNETHRLFVGRRHFTIDRQPWLLPTKIEEQNYRTDQHISHLSVQWCTLSICYNGGRCLRDNEVILSVIVIAAILEVYCRAA